MQAQAFGHYKQQKPTMPGGMLVVEGFVLGFCNLVQKMRSLPSVFLLFKLCHPKLDGLQPSAAFGSLRDHADSIMRLSGITAGQFSRQL